MRICIEAASLARPRSGVGHSTASLVEGLLEADPDVQITLLPLTSRGRRALGAPDDPRVAVATRVPARPAVALWTRATWPPAELFAGPADVVHGPNFVLPPSLKGAGVLTVHDVAFWAHPDTCSAHVRTYARSVPVFARRAERVVVPSEAVASELAHRLPAEAAKIRVVPQAVRDVFMRDGGPLTPPRREVLGLSGPYVVYVGGFNPRKNTSVLYRAWETAARKRPGAKLVVVGVGDPGPHPDGVIAPGYLPDAEVAALLRGAHAFVYPSVYEGFGMPPLEALACGTPAVVSDIAPHREVVGADATLVDPQDVEGWSTAILEHLEAPRRADPARARSFTRLRTAKQTLDVYREAVAEHQRGR